MRWLQVGLLMRDCARRRRELSVPPDVKDELHSANHRSRADSACISVSPIVARADKVHTKYQSTVPARAAPAQPTRALVTRPARRGAYRNASPTETINGHKGASAAAPASTPVAPSTHDAIHWQRLT